MEKQKNSIIFLLLLALILDTAIMKMIPKRVFMSKETVNISLNMKITKDNVYQVFYTYEGGNVKFNEKDSVKIPVVHKDNFQTINFSLPVTEIQNFRVDFGKVPGEVYISDISLIKGNNRKKLSAEELSKILSYNGIEEVDYKGDVLRIFSEQKDPFVFPKVSMQYGKDLRNKVQVNKVLLTFTSILLILIVIFIKVYGLMAIMEINIFNFAIVVIFVCTIIIPMCSIDKAKNSSFENRPLATKPQMINGRIPNFNYSKEFDNWFNDHYGLRNKLIEYNSLLQFKLFKTSASDRVIVGKDGWLFYGDKNDGDSVSYYQNTNLYNKSQLMKITEVLTEQKQWCEKRGINYIVFIAPNKNSIYGEYYPNRIHKIGKYSRLDQVLDYLKMHSDIDIIDVRNDLIQSKKSEQLYYKTDTHWNSYGAFIGYQALINGLNKYYNNLKPNKIEDYKISKKPRNGGDLSQMLNLSNYFGETEIVFKKDNEVTPQFVKTDIPRRVITELNEMSLPKVVMFRDSFATNMQPFLSNHFSRILYEWSNEFNMNLIEEESPDVVINELVERHLDTLLIDNPRGMK